MVSQPAFCGVTSTSRFGSDEVLEWMRRFWLSYWSISFPYLEGSDKSRAGLLRRRKELVGANRRDGSKRGRWNRGGCAAQHQIGGQHMIAHRAAGQQVEQHLHRQLTQAQLGLVNRSQRRSD